MEENGAESCDITPNSSFVSVQIPLRIRGDGHAGQAHYYYSIGGFQGRETSLRLEDGLETVLRFRVPLELFRGRERLSVEIFETGATGAKKTLWVKRWEIAWQGKIPSLEPMERTAE